MINNKNIIIVALVIVILAMVVGYSTFATQLTINGTTEITGIWDVRITGVEAQNVSTDCNAGEPEFTTTTVSFNAELAKPGDSVEYVITIKNEGNLDAHLDDIVFLADEANGSPAIKYYTTNLAADLLAGETTTLTVTVKYDESFTEVPEVKTKTITGIINYVQER